MKLHKTEIILLCILAILAIFVTAKIITATSEQIYETEMSELPSEMDSSEEISVSETTVESESIAKSENIGAETNEAPTTEELYPETEKSVETAYFESQSIQEETEVTTVTAETESTDTIFNDDNSTLNDSVTDCHLLYLGNFKICGYTAEEGFYYGRTTASGIGCHEGICAMNRTRMKELGISYGDCISIDGIGTYIVADCGCSYGTIDVWCWTNAEAYSLTSHRDVYLVR